MNGEIELTIYACGHDELKVKGAVHHLCVACDSHMLYLSGLTDEDRRFKLWTDDPTYHRARCNCARCNKQWDEILKSRG